MSDLPPAPPPAPLVDAGVPSGRARCAVVGLAVALVLLLGYAVLAARASAALDARTRVIVEEAALWNTRSKARPPLLGEPADGDAVAHYFALEHALGGRAEWGGQPPAGTAPALQAQVEAPNALATLEAALSALRAGAAPSPEAQDLLARLAPLRGHVREGLRRREVDWRTDLREGFGASVPYLFAYRAIAFALACEAARAPAPAEAVERALEVVLLGRDLEHGDTLIGRMIGVSLRRIGHEALAHALGRAAGDPAALRRALEALGQVEPRSLRGTIEGERVAMLVELARLTGRDSGGRRPEFAPSYEGPTRWLGPVVFAREWDLLEAFYAELAPACELPAHARAAAALAAQERAVAPWSVITRLAVPDFARALQQVAAVDVEASLVRAAAAALLARHERGDWPPAADAFAAAGLEPKDPFRADGAALGLRADDDGGLTLWSAGPDGKDDGGAPTKKGEDAGDLVVRVVPAAAR